MVTPMTSVRFFDWFVLGALACLLGLGIARAGVLYARGVSVVVIDWQRTPREQLVDLLLVVVFLAWFYETVAYAWPLHSHVIPARLAVVVVESSLVKVVGMLAIWAGLLIFALALWAFADSWRIGIDRHTPGALTTHGIFAWTRNPIYIALDLMVFGTFLVLGRVIFLALVIALTGLLHAEIRREENYLARTYGSAYREYCARVGRYVRWR